MNDDEFHLVNRLRYERVRTLNLRDDVATELETKSGYNVDIEPDFFLRISKDLEDVSSESKIRNVGKKTIRTSASFVTHIPQGRVFSQGFIVADRNNAILSDSFRALGMLKKFGFNEIHDRTYVFSESGSKPRIRASEGVNIVLGAQTNKNYFHWMFESLAKIQLFEAIPTSEYKILVPNMTSWMREAARIAGLEPSRFAAMDVDILECEHLVFPARGLSNIFTFTPHAISFVDRWIAAFGATNTSCKRRRVFVSRSTANNRYVSNESQLIEIAQRHGFEVVNPEKLSLEQQVTYFREAEFVTGALGAGLTNFAFMHPNGAVLELAPEGRTGDATLFHNLAAVRKLRYGCIVGKKVECDAPEHLKDFYIDPAFFSEGLALLS